MRKGYVSVIIPTYRRHFPMLERAIKSVLEQTYPFVEAVVISDNDPGDEYALEIAEALKAYPTVKFIQMPKNSGSSVARNTGIKASDAEFIGLCDDDDFWLPNKLDVQIPMFDKAEIGLVFSNGYIFTKEDRSDAREYLNRNEYIERPTFRMELGGDHIRSTVGTLIRHSALDECGGFDESMKAVEDHELFMRIIKSYQARGTLEKLYYIYSHGECLSKDYATHVESYLYIIQKYQDDYEKCPDALARVYYLISRCYARLGDRKNERVYAKLSFQKDKFAFLQKELRRRCPRLAQLFLRLRSLYHARS